MEAEEDIESEKELQSKQETPNHFKMKTPLNKKSGKKRLKKVPKNMNTTLSNSARKNMNFSFLNNTAVKQSLRANNRALAQNLQKSRHELKMAAQENTELHKMNKELEMRVLTLERVAGLQDTEIEAEVQKRLDETMMAMIEAEVQQRIRASYIKLKQTLVKAGESLYQASSNISEALNECVETTRRSTISSFRMFKTRSSGSSAGSVRHSLSEDEQNVVSPPSKRLQSQNVPESDIPFNPSQREVEHSQNMDMSVIMEQPTFVEENTPFEGNDGLDNLPEKIPEEIENETLEEEKGANKKKNTSKLPLPQRVPRKQREQAKKDTSDEMMSKSEPQQMVNFSVSGSKSDSAVVIQNKDNILEDDRRKTFLVPSVANKNPEIVVEAPSNGGDLGNVDFPSSDDRRGTFVLPPKNDNLLNVPDVSGPIAGDHTVILNSDMEMTEVINFSQPISCAGSPNDELKSQQESSKVNLSESDSFRQKLEELQKKVKKVVKPRNDDNVKTDKSTVNVSTEGASKSAVECKMSKPGKFVFSATRKDLDGFRKPVPVPVKKMKGKSMVKLSKDVKSLKGQTTPAKSGSVFDFQDKTPNIHTEKSVTEHAVKNAEKSKEVSKETADSTAKKNETEERRARARTREKKKELNDETDQTDKSDAESSQNVRINNAEIENTDPNEIDGMIYHIPLKGCSPEQTQPLRSRSRRRQSYKEFFDASGNDSPIADLRKRKRSQSSNRRKKIDDDDDYVPSSRGRSKNRKQDEEEEGDVRLNTKRSKSRGRSLTRNVDSSKTKEEEVVQRGRSRSRKVVETEEGNKEENRERLTRSKSRGRSLTRKTEVPGDVNVDEDIDDYAKKNESPECIRVRAKSRGRSRSRRDGTDKGKACEVDVKATMVSRGRSRSRIVSHDEESRNEDADIKTRSVDTREQVVEDEKKNDKEQTENVLVSISDESCNLENESPVDVSFSSNNENEEKQEEKSSRKSSYRKGLTRKSSSRKSASSKNSEIAQNNEGEMVTNSPENLDNSSSKVQGSEFLKPTEVSKPLNSTKNDTDLISSRKVQKENENKDENGTAEINNRLTFISNRVKALEPPHVDDEELTFSDFDHMYKVKRTMSDFEKGKEEDSLKKKLNDVDNSSKDIPTVTKKSVKKRKLKNDKICETPKVKTSSEISPARTKTKKSSAKSKKEDKDSIVIEKENDVEDTGKGKTSLMDKLKLINDRMNLLVGGVPSTRSLDLQTEQHVLGDVGNTIMGNITPSVEHNRSSLEPSAKRSCRKVASQISYKEKPLNKKMRRGDIL